MFNRTSLIILIIVALLVVGAVLGLSLEQKTKPDLDNFARCLSDRGIVMYGTYWCPHCKNEKNAFGDSFQFVNYVECTENPNECLAKGIEGYPTWIFPDGKKLIGEQGITKLREISGCPL